MCPLRNLDHARRLQPDITEEGLRKIEPYLKNAENIFLQGIGGEPLLSPSLFAVLGMVRGSTVHVQFDTNGLLLTELIARKLIDSRLSGISISVDATTARTYQNIRRNNGFLKVIENIETLQALKRSLCSDDPSLTISMVLMKENLAEAESFIDLGKRLNVAKVVMRGLTPIERNYRVASGDIVFDYEEQKICPDDEHARSIIKKVYEKARANNVLLDSDTAFLRKAWGLDDERDGAAGMTPVCKGAGVYACDRPWDFLLIDIFGNVSFCCHMRERLGNIYEAEIADILDSSTARSIRTAFTKGHIPQACVACNLLR
jgi:MoaA/NifB/PqqE/SkfB family radical SAM enzyme